MAKAFHDSDGGASRERAGLFAVGRNCSAVAHAQRVGLLVDGEEYFRSFALAALEANRSIVILAWDFNSGTRLNFDGVPREAPPQLGDFLNWLVHRRPGLEIFILDWDYPLVFGTDRELRPLYGLGWRPRRHVHLVYDDTHPVAASHHQKIVVVDDSIAFIGGLDLTARRWDTCAHMPADERRIHGSSPYPPFHDVMMAVDGEAARALAAIVRARWRAATGHALPAVAPQADWPKGLRIDLTDVDVALARTMPEIPPQPAVAEVEALYLDMIAAARRDIYIENQYFTASRIGDALEARLGQPEGPEIVVVVRLFSHGWLEENTMHVLRARLVHRLRAADRYGRFHILYPHVDGLDDDICIDLHSKVMIVDDEILRIGSANLSNRSMGMDSECDAAIEARADPRLAAAIRGFRNRLLGEHLDVAPAAVEDALRRRGSLRGAIDALAGRDRTLRPLENQPDWPQTVLELAAVGDPERPLSLDALIEELNPEQLIAEEEEARRPPPRRRLLRAGFLRLGLAVLVLATLAGLWRYTPLASWIDADRVTAIAHEFAGRRWAPLALMLAYTPACVVLFPRALLTLGGVVAFGPQLGCLYALVGIVLAALLTYLAGLRLPHHTIRNLTGQRLLDLVEPLRRRSLISVTALRLVPLAPFSIESIVAGAVRIPLLPFLLGTLIGVLPGTLATTVFGGQLEAALRDPSQVNYPLLAAVVVAVALLSLVVRRWLVAQHRSAHHGHDGDRAR